MLSTWNGATWIGEQLESIAAQTRLPAELVVQDDHSQDDTVSIVERFARTAPFEVRIDANPQRLGSTRTFAAALERSRGQFIALSDQDDVWYPHKLERVVHELELDATITMVLSDANLIDDTGAPAGRSLWDSRFVGSTLRRHEVISGQMLARRALTTGCTMVLRRRAVAAALPFPTMLTDPTAPMRHDRWLSLISASVGTVRALPEPLIGFRVHPAQETGVLLGSAGPRAFGHAAWGAVSGRIDDRVRGHAVRAEQLEVAAQRVEEVGDFEEAETLRDVAAHFRQRSRGESSSVSRLVEIAGQARRGLYGWDRLGLASVAGDLVRALRPPERAV